jgi:hypothetical protein
LLLIIQSIMLAQQSLAASSMMRINYMDALSKASEEDSSLASPDTPPPQSSSDGFTFEMSDLMLPASALESELFGIPAAPESSATVVSTASSSDEMSESSPPVSVITTTTSSRSSKRKSVNTAATAADRRHAIPASALILSQSPLGEAVTQPVPEFLCHLFAMLRDPSYADLLSWEVPTEDEPDHMGGGIAGIGKIVVHKPEALQDFVLGKYYRHSKYASFQRQLNYFGFKKRLHGGKKGKLSPCSYIHEKLTEDVGSLFSLKRRPPAKKRASECMEMDSAASVSSNDETSTVTTKTSSSSKKRRLSPSEKKAKRIKKDKKDKKRRSSQQGKQQVAVSSMPIQVTAEEYAAPTLQTSAAITNNQFQPQQTPSIAMAPKPEPQVSAPTEVKSNPTVQAQRSQDMSTSSPEAQPTLLELLSTSLPPSDVLFNDEVDSVDEEGVPAWVTDDGKYHYHNVDSSLIDLAMLY